MTIALGEAIMSFNVASLSVAPGGHGEKFIMRDPGLAAAKENVVGVICLGTLARPVAAVRAFA